MMVLPGEEELKMFRMLNEWFRYELDTDYIYLADDAPEDVKKIYPVYVKKYGKGGYWRPVGYKHDEE